tara:strand:+ start:50 stop:289 length:240 start_codon:yes stop_codon:yes gene_type:complete
MAIKGGAKISDLVRVVTATGGNFAGDVGLVIGESLDKKTGRRILLVRWSFKKTKQKKSDMVEFWIYEEELELVSEGARK